MRYVIRSVVTAFAIALFLPFAADAQAPKANPLQKKLAPSSEARWNKMLQAAQVLAQEGAEVKRITPAEHKQIADFVGSTRAFIAKAKAGGISEAEEDGIDNNIAEMMTRVAAYFSDAQRKAAAPIAKPAAKK